MTPACSLEIKLIHVSMELWISAQRPPLKPFSHLFLITLSSSPLLSYSPASLSVSLILVELILDLHNLRSFEVTLLFLSVLSPE